MNLELKHEIEELKMHCYFTGDSVKRLQKQVNTKQARKGASIRAKNINVVTDPPVMLAHKVGPGLQDLQKRGQRILAERNAEKAEENMWISRMVAAESIGELNGLIKSRAT